MDEISVVSWKNPVIRGQVEATGEDNIGEPFRSVPFHFDSVLVGREGEADGVEGGEVERGVVGEREPVGLGEAVAT